MFASRHFPPQSELEVCGIVTTKKMEGWLKKQRELLEIESQSEASQLLEKIRFLPSKLCEQEGLSICNLEVLSTKTELFGRCCVEFQKIGKLSIPSGFKVGDEVTIISSEQSLDSEEEGDDSRELHGLVKKCNNYSIEIVFDEYERSLAYPPLRLNLRPSLTTHHRMMDVLEKLQSTPHPLFNLVHSPDDFPIYSSFLHFENERVSKWYNGLLNESQKEAIDCCLNSSLVSIIHGPPGTGE
jgi:DNA polymerase alpha-associated DNA helicase A